MTTDELAREIRRHLALLASGDTSPEDAADWAAGVMASDQDGPVDRRLWHALDLLAGADLPTAPGVLLHGPADFAAWLQEFEAEGERA